MSEWNMLVWLTQLGLSVVVPLTGFTCLAVWLRERFSLGIWVVLLALFAGFACAVQGFRTCLKEMERMERRRGKMKSVSATKDSDK